MNESKEETQGRSYIALIESSRRLCGCYACNGGPREIGSHTIAQPTNPRSTPGSCVAAVLLEHMLGGLKPLKLTVEP